MKFFNATLNLDLNTFKYFQMSNQECICDPAKIVNVFNSMISMDLERRMANEETKFWKKKLEEEQVKKSQLKNMLLEAEMDKELAIEEIEFLKKKIQFLESDKIVKEELMDGLKELSKRMDEIEANR